MLESMVELRPSGVCNGLGVFALVDIPANTDATRYDGVRIRDVDLKGDAAYALELGKGWTLDGTVVRADEPHNGLAQMANDAIHPEISGTVNNCRFRTTSDGAFLRTVRRVAAGEELLVPYCLPYWLYRRNFPSLPPKLTYWLRCHHAIVKCVMRCGFEVHEYVSSRDVSPVRSAFRYAGTLRKRKRTPCCSKVRFGVSKQELEVHLFGLTSSGTVNLELVCPHCSHVLGRSTEKTEV